MAVAFLTADELAAYGRYASEPPGRAELERFFFLDDADQELVAIRRGEHNRFGFALMLVSVRCPGLFPADPLEVPWMMVEYVADQVGVSDPSCLKRNIERAKTRLEHQWEITDRYGYPLQTARNPSWGVRRASMPAELIRDAAVPLRTLDPTEADMSDLEMLREVVGNARVVCLGESAHFTSEFSQLRDRVLRFLVRELGFSAFVVESGLPEGLAVDRWVRGGPGECADIARTGITYAFGRCAEMHNQLQWMRDWNSTHDDQVGFYGMDVPGWCANPGPGVAACLARLAPQPGDNELLAAAELGQPGRAPSIDASDTAGVAPWVARGIAELVERATAAGDQMAVQCARGAQAVVEFLDQGLYPGAGRNLRNEAMAENLRWILNREDHVLVGAHNLHLQNAPSFDGTATIGSLLTPELGNDLVTIGATHAVGAIPDFDLDAAPERRYFTSDGEPPPPASHTLEATLDTAEFPQHLVHLRRTPPAALAGITTTRAQTPDQTLLIELDPQRAFDAVIHLHRITPAHGAADHPDSTPEP